MRVVVDITEELFNRIKEVNQHSSLSSFILVAIENQISLEKEQSTDNIELIKDEQKTSDKSRDKDITLKKPLDYKSDIEILNKPLNYEKISGIPLKNPIKNYYVWGQYNKFFAMKFSVRYLAYMQIQNNASPVKISDFQNKCSRAASMMKQILKQSDERAERVWGEGFSAGLPENEEKSWTRFIHHFIGYADSKGNQVGSISDIGFIVIDNGHVALSPHGLAFAKIKNPILDEDPFSPNLFSLEEQQFLINHIKTHIPVEWKGIQTVIQWINDGNNSPDKLNAKFATLDSKWTTKMANTYRTGILARMYDLGFIIRKKIGVNANYVVTDMGNTIARDV
jgi:hypothetical protein